MDKILIISFLTSLFLGVVPAFIASSKGRNFFVWYLYGAALFLIAVIHAIVIKPNEKAKGMQKCPSCASVISKDASICPACRTLLTKGVNHGNGVTQTNEEVAKSSSREKELIFDGERNINSPAYQLFLTRKYTIEKNTTLEKYTIDNLVFAALQDALVEANERYSAKLEQLERQRIADEQILGQKKLNAEIEERQRLEKIESDREQIRKRMEIEAPLIAVRERKVKLLFSAVVAVSVVTASVLFYKHRVEVAKIEALQREEAERRMLAEKEAERKLRERKAMELETNAQLFAMFSDNNFFGFKLGDNNLKLLAQKAKIDHMEWKGSTRKLFAGKGYGAFNYVTLDGWLSPDGFIPLIQDKGIAGRIKSISFSYCSRGNVPLDISNKSAYESMKLIGVYIKLEDVNSAQSFDSYVSNKMPKSKDWLEKFNAKYSVAYDSQYLNFESLIRKGKGPNPYLEYHFDPCGNPYNYFG